jgi:hypothetical protein
VANIFAEFPSKYLKAEADLEDGEVINLTVAEYKRETLGQGSDAETKPVLYFKETKKGLVINKTNAKTLAKLYGGETDGWIGKPISLIRMDVQYPGGEMGPGMRVKTSAPKAGAVFGFKAKAAGDETPF